MNIALAAAAEVPNVSLVDALALCRLLAQSGDERYPRAASRWLERLSTERRATLAEIQLAAGALARLCEEPNDELAMRTLDRLAARARAPA